MGHGRREEERPTPIRVISKAKIRFNRLVENFRATRFSDATECSCVNADHASKNCSSLNISQNISTSETSLNDNKLLGLRVRMKHNFNSNSVGGDGKVDKPDDKGGDDDDDDNYQYYDDDNDSGVKVKPDYKTSSETMSSAVTETWMASSCLDVSLADSVSSLGKEAPSTFSRDVFGRSRSMIERGKPQHIHYKAMRKRRSNSLVVKSSKAHNYADAIRPTYLNTNLKTEPVNAPECLKLYTLNSSSTDRNERKHLNDHSLSVDDVNIVMMRNNNKNNSSEGHIRRMFSRPISKGGFPTSLFQVEKRQGVIDWENNDGDNNSRSNTQHPQTHQRHEQKNKLTTNNEANVSYQISQKLCTCNVSKNERVSGSCLVDSKEKSNHEHKTKPLAIISPLFRTSFESEEVAANSGHRNSDKNIFNTHAQKQTFLSIGEEHRRKSSDNSIALNSEQSAQTISVISDLIHQTSKHKLNNSAYGSFKSNKKQHPSTLTVPCQNKNQTQTQANSATSHSKANNRYKSTSRTALSASCSATFNSLSTSLNNTGKGNRERISSSQNIPTFEDSSSSSCNSNSKSNLKVPNSGNSSNSVNSSTKVDAFHIRPSPSQSPMKGESNLSIRGAKGRGHQRRHLTLTVIVFNAVFILCNFPITIYMAGRVSCKSRCHWKRLLL